MNIKFCLQYINKGKWVWKEVFMTQTINLKREPLSMNKRDDGAKVENKEDGKITGKSFPLFDHTGYKIVTIDALKK